MINETKEVIPQGVSDLVVSRFDGRSFEQGHDFVAQEIPVALVFNGISHAVMMATPADLEDFALGFGLTEGLLASKAELYGIEQKTVQEGIEVHLEVSSKCESRLKERRRTLAGRTGCGLCGTDSLSLVRQKLNPVKEANIKTTSILKAHLELQNWQTLQHLTGATHAAAWVDESGQIIRLREDVGRHNALDKLIGNLVDQELESNRGFICITSRASFEMVQKSIFIGSPLLASVSAPTAFAVELAKNHNLALAGFIRGNGLVAYTFPERF